MDHGTEALDADYGPYQERVDQVLRQQGRDAAHFQTLVFESHSHKETAKVRIFHETTKLFRIMQNNSE